MEKQFGLDKTISVPVRTWRTADNSPAIHRWGKATLATKSVKRTTERVQHPAAAFSRPLYGLDFLRFHPSSELLGYCQSSALRGLNMLLFVQSQDALFRSRAGALT